jgi:hypothetical protein
MGPKMADFWDWIVPNVAGETNAKVADARKQYAGANGRLDPNAISAETLASYGVPSQVTEDASPYLSTYKMGNDISKSALTPPERGMGETIGGLLQAAAIPVSFAQGNKGFGAQLFDDNIMTRDAKRKSSYEDAQRESVLKNAQNLTGNVDQIIAEQQKARSASRARKDTQSARENEADRYGLTGAERNRYILEGKYDAEFMDKSGNGKGPSPYILNPDGSASPRPGGPADPKTVSTLSEARGRGGMNVPIAVRTAGINADQAYQALIPLLDEYEKTITDPNTGTGRVWGPFEPVEADKVNQQRKNIQLQLKELYNLGVLNGPDLALMNQMLFDPSVSINPMQVLNGITSKITGGGTDTSSAGNAFWTQARTKQSVGGLKETLRGIRNSKTRALGMDDIGPDGRPIPGSGKAYAGQGTSIDPAAPEGTSVAPQANDFTGLSDDDIKAQLGIE